MIYKGVKIENEKDKSFHRGSQRKNSDILCVTLWNFFFDIINYNIQMKN